ncbi:uncharacterized protein LOC126761818 [Bactrocera neohumeralis]|uniref:uncharacterized protein LOC126761818 n=1 Tax=Bactrocera neohumeralis TaxID=98809 RepID=UPI002165AC1F|nr:uncharacterized protein LOC126761818 [Bactrocera neohumeralis]
MSFEETLYQELDLAWDQSADKIQLQAESATEEEPTTSQPQDGRKQTLPIPASAEVATSLRHNPFTLPLQPFQSSCSSQTLFPPPPISQARQLSLQLTSQHPSTSKQSNFANKLQPNPQTYNLVQQIIQTVGELENTILEDRQNDFNFRIAYERQTEQLKNMCQSLDNEKARNVRLMELIRGVDACSATEDEEPEKAVSRCCATEHWSCSSEAYDSISPLLMQQRYDELSISYKKCRRQLIKKEKLLQLSRCETETAKARYDNLLDEYLISQKRFEEVCFKYLQFQARKNLEIQRLRDALNNAGECIVNAQQLIDCLDEETITLYANQNMKNLYDDNNNSNNNDTATNETDCIREFKQNLELFVKSLRLCQRVQQHNNIVRENNESQQ